MTTTNASELFKSNAEFHANINDLIQLGWELSQDDNDKYHVVIRYYANSNKFTMQIVNSQKLLNKIWEGGDEENAGDTEMIKDDLTILFNEGKLFNVDLEKEWM